MMPDRTGKPEAKRGVAHLLASARHSVAGARRLWREAAFRQEVAALALLVVLFLVVRATAGEVLGLLLLGLLVLAVEALNSAIEEVVDHVSPGWAEFAKHAKDMGSFAVMCGLVATGLYAAWVVLF